MFPSVAPGLYGKLPILGDFVSRRLPAAFVQTWDAWIQQALSASREQLDAKWLEYYLTSPIWRFILSPGNCCDRASAGILMPSVDKVGRYFPLTLAAMIEDQDSLPYLFITAADWFDRLEQLALTALEDDVDLNEFDRKLQDQLLSPPVPTTRIHNKRDNLKNKNGDALIRIEMERLEQIPTAFINLGACLLNQFFPAYSLWATNGSEQMKPSLLAYRGLPPVNSFSDFLVGKWQGYEVSNSNGASPSLPNPSPPEARAAGLSREGSIGISIKWRSCGRSTVGKVRNLNEDAFLENPESGVWAVADGMGGHSAGDEASKAVVDALRSIQAGGTLETLSAKVTACLRETNTELIRRAQKKKQNQIMGSTVVVMLAAGERCASIWAGDSRLYRYRGGLLSQMTRDHSLVSEMSRQDILSPEALAVGVGSNIVTRALGAVPELDVDVITFRAKTGDTYLLCSDGLIKEVKPNELTEILSQSDCHESSRALIDLALARGARDNVTVIVVTADREPKSSELHTASHAL
jgi:type VI secretion system protein ImpM